MFKKDEIVTAWQRLYDAIVALIRNVGNLIDQHWRKVFDWRKVLAVCVAFIILVVFVVAFISLPWIAIITEYPGTVLSLIVSVLGFALTGVLLYVQISNSRKQIAAEQFRNAIDHLGDEKQAIALGGVHALHNLAMTFPKEYSQQVFEVLCGFIREETTKDEYREKVSVKIEPSAKKQTAVSKPPIPVTSLNIIRTIVDKIFRYQKENKYVYIKYRAILIGAFLRRTTFFSANLKLANLRGADLQGAILYSVDLRGANLSGANLRETDLCRAHLQGANLCGTHLQGEKLKDADFRGVKNVGMYFYEHRKAIEEVMENGTDLETDLSGITLYDDDGNELDLDEDGKKAWFRGRGANVENLPAEEVQESFKDFGYCPGTALSKNYMNDYQKVSQITLFSIWAAYLLLFCSKSKGQH